MNKKRVAIYGGTFDPIHLAHFTLADCAVKQLNLDELYFMPTYISPFKQNMKVSSGKARCEMISSILSYNPSFKLSKYELENAKPSYTFDTLTYWKSHIDAKLYFVLGIDSLVQVDTWYRGEEILKNYSLITDVSRPGINSTEALNIISGFRNKYNADISIIDMSPMDISATVIRDLASREKDFSKYVLPEVEEYIIEHKLYK